MDGLATLTVLLFFGIFGIVKLLIRVVQEDLDRKMRNEIAWITQEVNRRRDV